MSILITRAAEGDIDDILAMATALVATDAGRYDAAATNVDWASASGLGYCHGVLSSEANVVFLARSGATPIGHLVGRLSGPGSVHPIRVAELESLFVDGAYRGEGLGSRLVDAFLGWAASKGADRATVTAYAANAGAQRFYERHGFAPRSVILDRDIMAV